MTFGEVLLRFATIALSTTRLAIMTHTKASSFTCHRSIPMAAPPQSTDDEAAAVACGVVSLTPAAEFPLRTICGLPCIAFAQVLDEASEFQQIR